MQPVVGIRDEITELLRLSLSALLAAESVFVSFMCNNGVAVLRVYVTKENVYGKIFASPPDLHVNVTLNRDRR